MTGVTVRAAQAADIPELIRLGAHMYASVGATVDDAWRALAGEELARRLGVDLFGWVIDDESGTGLAACAFANLNARLPLPNASSPWRAYIQWVAVDQACERRGYASALMGQVEAWATGRQVQVLELVSSPAGRALYRRLGFEYAPDVHYPDDVRGVPMRKRLAGPAAH